jgi:hypothetical protein
MREPRQYEKFRARNVTGVKENPLETAVKKLNGLWPKVRIVVPGVVEVDQEAVLAKPN